MDMDLSPTETRGLLEDWDFPLLIVEPDHKDDAPHFADLRNSTTVFRVCRAVKTADGYGFGALVCAVDSTTGVVDVDLEHGRRNVKIGAAQQATATPGLHICDATTLWIGRKVITPKFLLKVAPSSEAAHPDTP